MAAILERSTAIADTNFLASLRSALLLVSDSSVLRATLSVSRHPTAAPAARITALFAALGQIDPSVALKDGTGFEGLLAVRNETRCPLTVSPQRKPYRSVTSLPPAAPWMLFTAAESIARSEGPPNVRLFAHCVAQSVDPAQIVPPAAVSGFVRDTGGRPVVAADIIALGSRSLARTDHRGEFLLGGLLPGAELLMVRAVGHEPLRFGVTLTAGDTVPIEAVLGRSPQRLADIEVRYGRSYHGKLADFARRMLSSPAPRSSFVGPEEIEEWGRFDLTNVFRRTGLPVSGNRIACPLSASIGARGFSIHVYLDDALVGQGPTFDVTSFPVQWIAAVEVYRRVVEAPVRYQAIGAACVVLLTTK